MGIQETKKIIMETRTVKAFGTDAADAPLKAMNIERREVQPHDLEIEITYCGICHSDLHAAKNDWGGTAYPMVPGHEIVGKVTKVGESFANRRPEESFWARVD